MTKKRILITGAAGFLGSHLCDKFIKEGMHVIGMDNLITGDLKNIQHLFKLEELFRNAQFVVSVKRTPPVFIINSKNEFDFYIKVSNE